MQDCADGCDGHAGGCGLGGSGDPGPRRIAVLPGAVICERGTGEDPRDEYNAQRRNAAHTVRARSTRTI